MLFQYDYFDETRSFGKDMIGWMVLQTTSPSVNDQVAKAIDQMFANSSYETSTDTEKAFNKAFVAQLGNIALIVDAGGRRGLRDHPDDRRQHHDDGDARAHARDRRAQDARLLRAGASCAWCSARSLLLALLGGIPGPRARGAGRHAGHAPEPGQFRARLRGRRPASRSPRSRLMLVLGLATGLMPALNALRLKIAAALGRG